MKFHDLKIRKNGNYEIELDNKPLGGVYHASISFNVNEIPKATLKLFNSPEIDTDAYVEFDYTPDTFGEALGVVRSTIENEPIIYEALVNNVDNMIKDGNTAKEIVNTVLSMMGL